MSIFNIFRRNKIDPDTRGRKISSIEQELLDRCKNGNSIKEETHPGAFGFNDKASGNYSYAIGNSVDYPVRKYDTAIGKYSGIIDERKF